MKPYVSEPLPGNYYVLGFYGPAGTGKSMRSQMLASQRKIDLIIDDGLLIARGRIIAGRSAKTEANMVRAIRRAMFHFADHREEVRRCLAGYSGSRIMVLSTSKGMNDDICRTLGLPLPTDYITIDEIATTEEIARALHERKQNKRHVIPVSQAQIRRNYTGRLVGRLKNLFSHRDESEKTIVRPPFSYFGALKIEPEVIEQIADYAVRGIKQVADVKDLKIRYGGDSGTLDDDEQLIISMTLSVRTGMLHFIDLNRQAALRVRVAVEELAGMKVKQVNVAIADVIFDEER